MQRLEMKLEVLKGDVLGQINQNFRVKVQLEEQLKENEVQLHYRRGQLDAWIKVQAVIQEIRQGDEIQAMNERDARAGDNHTGQLPVEAVRDVA